MMTVETRTVAVLLHPERPEALEAATAFMSQMPGFRFLSFSDDVERLRELVPGADLESIDGKPSCEQRNGPSPWTSHCWGSTSGT